MTYESSQLESKSSLGGWRVGIRVKREVGVASREERNAWGGTYLGAKMLKLTESNLWMMRYLLGVVQQWREQECSDFDPPPPM